MWGWKRLWLLFIALLHLKGVRAFGVWNKKHAQDWYSVAAQTPLDQLQGTASFPDGAQISTIMRGEGKANAGTLQTSMASWAGFSSSDALKNGSFPTSELQKSYGTQSSGQSGYLSSMRPQSGNAVPSPLYQKRPPQFASTFHTRPLGVLLSQQQSLQKLSIELSSPKGSFQTQKGINQFGSAPVGTVTPQSTDGITTANGSSTGSQSQSSSTYWLLVRLPSQYVGSQAQQGVNQLGSVSGLIVTQQASESIMSNGSTSNTSGSYSGSQSQGSIGYGSSQGLVHQYDPFQTQGTTQQSAAPAFNAALLATEAAQTANGSSISSLSAYSGSQSQSSSAYWLSLRLPSQYVGSQKQQGINQLGSVPGLTAIQQASDSVLSNGSSTSTTFSSYSGSQSQGSTLLGIFQGLVSQYDPIQTRGTIQPSAAPGFAAAPQATEAAPTANGSTISSLSAYSGSQSQSSSAYWLSVRLPSQYVGSQAQQGVNQLGSVSGLIVTQQAPESMMSNGSTSSTSGSYTGSQSQNETGYGPSRALSNLYGGLRTQQGIQQVSSTPALTVNQQASESPTASSDSNDSMSSIYSTSQNLGAFKQWFPARCLDQQSCKKTLFSGASSSISPSFSVIKSSVGYIFP